MKNKTKILCSTLIITLISTMPVNVFADAVSDARNELNSIKSQIEKIHLRLKVLKKK